MWCDDGLYPRKLYVNMVNGRPNWRCACFKEVGWSDVRQVGGVWMWTDVHEEIQHGVQI